MRGAHHGNVIAEGGHVLAGLDRLMHGLMTTSGDHHLLGRGGGDGGAEELALLGAVEHHGFTGGTEDD